MFLACDEGLASRFTGLFTRFGQPALRPHDPDVPMWVGSLAPCGPRPEAVEVGGAGWTAAQARQACLGEAIERAQTYRLPCDEVIEASHAAWALEEQAVSPDRWVLFHPEQYALEGFPFRPLEPGTPCRWVACRELASGEPVWVPEEFVFLFGFRHELTPSISTGLSCGRWGQPVLLRGLQEVIERDALMGAWWERYPLEEWPAEAVLSRLGAAVRRRVHRPNIGYRFYRVRTPFSAHTTVVTADSTDREGALFSAGAACREQRAASWEKALIEAIQGLHFVRYLKVAYERRPADERDELRDFADHALYYTVHPEQKARTVLARAGDVTDDAEQVRIEGLDQLRERLGAERPVLFRNLTPPALSSEGFDWVVLKVVVPGLQPMHGHHALPLLGGPLWRPRGWQDWAGTPPHPFP